MKKKKNVGIGAGLAIGTAVLIYISSGVGGATAVGLWTVWVLMGTWLVAFASKGED